MKETEGYFLVALGDNYITESSMIVYTLRKFSDTRPVSVLVHPEKAEHVRSIGLFDRVIEFNPSDEVWNDCSTDFEKYAVYPRINLDKYVCYERNIMLDTDVLCTHGTQRVWDLMDDRQIGTIGSAYDSEWHWGKIDEVIEAYGKNIPAVHGGFFYFRKGPFLDDFMSYCREVFFRYDEYNCKRLFRGGKVEEIILAIAHSKFDINPFEFHENIMGFCYEEKDQLPFYDVKYKVSKENKKDIIPFAHMMDKFGGKNYNDLLKKIMTS